MVLVGTSSEVGDGGWLFQCVVQSGECWDVELEGGNGGIRRDWGRSRGGNGVELEVGMQQD